ncbi:putative cysteine-rich receptor-like protein kinase 32 [Bienertia sinuspersici]
MIIACLVPLLDKSSSFDYDLGDAKFLQYDFASLKAATMDFSTNNKLGEGGFGAVYLMLLMVLAQLNGGQVAIKRLSGNSGQGAKEFITEAHLLAKLQHKNLVKLLGFCNEGNEKLLVYEFLPIQVLTTSYLVLLWL